MGSPAMQPAEIKMEERIARLEANVEHIQSDVTDLKVDVRELRRDMKSDMQELRHETHAGFRETDSKFERLCDRMNALERSLGSAKVWALMLYIAFAASMLGVMAHGFGWL